LTCLATNFCTASADENVVVEKCVITYIKSCTLQCLKRSSVTQRNHKLALKLCRHHSNSPKCIELLSKHTKKGIKKVHIHIIKAHIIKKVGVTKKQIHHAIQNKKVVIVEKTKHTSALQTELHQQEQEHKELEIKLLKAKEKKIAKINKIESKKQLQIEKEQLQKKLIVEEQENNKLQQKLLKEEKETKEIETKLVTEEKEKKAFQIKLHSEESAKHNTIEEEVRSHSQKCACETAKTTEEKKKCVAACHSRQTILKRKVSDYVEETSSACAVKANLACGHLKKNKEECKQCKKEFVVICIEEESKRKSELVYLLENCDD